MHPPGFLPFLLICSLSLSFAFAVFGRHLHTMSVTEGLYKSNCIPCSETFLRVRSGKVGSVYFSAGSSSTLRASVSDMLSGTGNYMRRE